jgi:WD40 repeat protein
MDVHNIRFYSSSGMLLNEYVSPAPLEKLTHNMFSWQGKFFLIGTAGHGDKTGKEREGRAIALFRGDGTHLWTIRPDFNFPALSGLTISHSEDRIAAWGETVIMDHVTKDPTKMVKSARSYIYFLDMNGNITAKHITDGWIRYVVLSPEGKYAAACTKEKVLLVNAENGNLVWEYKEMRNFISIDVSKEGERVVASGKERKCLLFDKSGRIIGEAKRKSSSPSYFSVKISDDGKLIQAEGTDGITLFEVK